MHAEQTTLTAETTGGLGALQFRHPAGTFALTPASRISVQAIAVHPHLLTGQGLDWGSGTGCLAIAAARVPGVERVIGLEIEPANVAAAQDNAVRNGVAARVTFLLSDSYAPVTAEGRALLDSLRGRVRFLLANPPSSEGDDGFGFRRVVLRGARDYLAPGAVVLLSISRQYGQQRVERLCQEVPGFRYGGILASTDWVPFDLGRPDLLHCLRLYADEEQRGGLPYAFRHPEMPGGTDLTAQAALVHYEASGKSPLTQWQTHLFLFPGS